MHEEKAVHLTHVLLYHRQTLILLVITGLLTTIGGMAYYNVGGPDSEDEKTDKDPAESFWAAWTFVADPGTHAGEVRTSS
jgi:hypothetical protein